MDNSGQARGFVNIIGQIDTIARLRAFANLYRSKDNPIGHVLLVGEEGMGKRSLSRAFAEEYNVNLREARLFAFVEVEGRGTLCLKAEPIPNTAGASSGLLPEPGTTAGK